MPVLERVDKLDAHAAKLSGAAKESIATSTEYYMTDRDCVRVLPTPSNNPAEHVFPSCKSTLSLASGFAVRQ